MFPSPRHLAVLSSLTVVAATLLAVAAPSAGAAVGDGAEFAPSVRPAQLHLQRTTRGEALTVHWRGPDRYRSVQRYDLDPIDDLYTVDQVGTTLRVGGGVPGALRNPSLSRNTALVSPDGYSFLDGDVMGYAWPLVARVRSGGSLPSVVVGGRTLLRGVTRLAANECAGLGAGTRTVDLDPATLAPRRVVDRRGRMVERSYTFAPLRAKATDFAPVRVVGRGDVRDDGFVRRPSASAVAALVSYPIAMPASLPAGFTLAHVASAPLGGVLGPEASFPRSRGVFVATWASGLEEIDLTIRPARSTLTRDWDQSDPFGGECAASVDSEVMVGATTARYAQGEFGSPRLWWRDGVTLYTLTGPYSAEQLATVARSLVPVEG